jgi:hypothetical protein
MLLHLVDAARKVLNSVLQNLFGNLFLIENNNAPDRAYAAAQILAYGKHLSDHNRRA